MKTLVKSGIIKIFLFPPGSESTVGTDCLRANNVLNLQDYRSLFHNEGVHIIQTENTSRRRVGVGPRVYMEIRAESAPRGERLPPRRYRRRSANLPFHCYASLVAIIKKRLQSVYLK